MARVAGEYIVREGARTRVFSVYVCVCREQRLILGVIVSYCEG